MFEDPSNSLGVAEILVALATHAWFKKSDPVPSSKAVLALAVLPSLPLLYLTYEQGSASFLSASFVLKSYAIFYAVLSLSLTAYRLSPFHPLAKYPGPLYLRVNRFWPVWIAYRGKYHIYLKGLHDKYGSTVRTGPNELSSIEKDLIHDVLVHHNMPKGPLWDGRRFVQTDVEKEKNYDSIVDVRDSTLHGQLRKPWSKAFMAEPMKNYEQLLIPRVNELNQHLRDVVKKGTNGVGKTDIAQWINFFAYDFMGDIAFGGAFDLMRDGDPRGQHQAMIDGMYLPSIMQHIPWVSNFLRPIPFIAGGMHRFVALGIEKSMERVNKGMTKKDLFYFMTESGEVADGGVQLIISNCLLAIVAGSDTSSSAMANAMHLIVSHPEKYEILRKEIDEAFNTHQIPDLDVDTDDIHTYADVLAGLKYLNAVINETLRLVPSIGTSLQRAPSKGSGGQLLQGGDKLSIYLPEGNSCTIAPYPLHRNERYFSPKPDSFIPERWIESTGYTTTRDAFIPFSMGPANCVGKPLAMMELRYVLATLVRNFNMEFDLAKSTPEQWVEDQHDRFTMVNGALNVNLTLRTKEMRGLK